MPDRIIRDELLESERWLGLKDNGDRLAYIALLLRADANGNFDGGEHRLMRLWRDFGIGTTALVAKTLSELVDHDLVRMYEANGRTLCHIPRYRQSLRYVKRVFPASPWDAEETKQRVTEKSHGEHVAPTESAHGAHSRSEVKRREVKGREEKSREPRSPAPPGFLAFWAAYPNLGRRKNKATCLALWNSRGLEAEAAAIVAHVEGMKRTAEWCPDSAGDHFEPEAERYLRKRNWEDGLPDSVSRRVRLAL